MNDKLTPETVRKLWTSGKKTSMQLIHQLARDLKISEQQASDLFFDSIAEYEEDV